MEVNIERFSNNIGCHFHAICFWLRKVCNVSESLVASLINTMLRYGEYTRFLQR